MTTESVPDAPPAHTQITPALDRPVLPTPGVLAFWLLVAVLLVTRLWNLGVKPLHHDESLFAYYGYNLAIGNGYNYMPILHGPVLQFASAVFFMLFGDSHFVMRLPSALGGLGLAWAFWCWRRELARGAGLDGPGVPGWLVWVPAGAALGLLALSPSITYYSRFLRNDAPYLAATVACALFTLRAFRDRSPRTLAIAILFATLMFCMMESSIFFFVACLGFLAAVVGAEVLRGPGTADAEVVSGAGGRLSLDGWSLALVTAAPAAVEVAGRLPLGLPDRTGLLLVWGVFALAHGMFLARMRAAGTLCGDIGGWLGRWRGPVLAVFCGAAVLTVLPHVLPGQAPPVWLLLSGLAPFAAFGLICWSLFLGCAGAIQCAADWLAKSRRAGDGPDASALGNEQSAPAESQLLLVLQAILLAAAGTALLAYLYWRIFMDTVPVDAPIRVVASLLGLAVERPAALAVACSLAALGLTAFFILYLTRLRRPPATALGHFAHTLHHGRLAILLSVAVSIFAYQALFTTFFTHTVDKTFNHQVRDFTEPTAPLTPVQIYKNTWDYWWDQHKEHRIKGPFHYYLPILGLYELPGMVLAAGGLAAFLLRPTPRRKHRLALLIGPHVLLAAMTADLARRIDWQWMDAKFHVTHPLHLHMALAYLQAQFIVSPMLWRAGRRVEAFLLFWTVTHIFAYSYAGEKVPWLSIHTAGPLLLLAGVQAGRLAGWWWRRSPEGAWPGRRSLLVSVAAVALVWQGKSLIGPCFLWPHSPRERIVFNHTTPDVEWALAEVEHLRVATGQGPQLSMFLEGEVLWPLYWYLRHNPELFVKGDETLATTRRPVIICDWDDAVAQPHIAENYRVHRLKVREWWEAPLLNFRAMADIHLALTARESRLPEGPTMTNALRLQAAWREWTKLGRHLVFREIFLDPNNSDFSNSGNEFCLAIRRDLDPAPKMGYLQEAPFRREIPVVR